MNATRNLAEKLVNARNRRSTALRPTATKRVRVSEHASAMSVIAILPTLESFAKARQATRA